MYDNREETDEHALIPSLMYTKRMAGKTEEAINFYTSVFPASKIDFIRKYGEQTKPEDNLDYIAHAEFTLVDQHFIAMDSSLDHKFVFNDAVSLSVSCKDQDEVDYYWDKFISNWWTASQCWWLQDKYGVRRQIVPIQLGDALQNSDEEKAKYAMERMLEMKKIIIDDLYQN